MPSVWWNGRRRREWKGKRPKDREREGEKNRRFQSRFSTKRNLKWNAPSWNYLRTHKSYINLDNGNFSNVIFTHQPLSFSMHFFRLCWASLSSSSLSSLLLTFFPLCAMLTNNLYGNVCFNEVGQNLGKMAHSFSRCLSISMLTQKYRENTRTDVQRRKTISLSLLFPYLANELFNFAS